MRFALLSILTLCLLTSLCPPCFSEKPLRLFFEKNTSSGPAPLPKYTVQQGDWLYKILQSRGYSQTEIQAILPTIQKLNPHIADVNALRPGQTLYLPDAGNTPRKQPALPAASTPTQPADSPIQKPYIVRSGDTLAGILKKHGVPENLIFNKYIQVFQELNPEIKDIHTLKTGQNVILPGLQSTTTSVNTPASNATIAVGAGTADSGGSATGNQKASGSDFAAEKLLPFLSASRLTDTNRTDPQTSGAAGNATNGTESNENTRTPVIGLPYVKTVLEQMRFSFSKGDEELYPLPDKTWLQVRLHETPVVTAPWGDKIVFCPIPKNDEWITRANQIGLHVCSVSPSWNLTDILGKLTSRFPNQLRLWEPGREIALSRNGLGLTMSCPVIAILQYSGHKLVYGLWPRHNANERPLPQGLPEVLGSVGVKIIELDQYNELSRLPFQPRDLYVPVATRTDLIRAMAPTDPEALFGKTLPESLNDLLFLLKSKNMLRKEFANLTWSGGNNRRMVLQIPAWIIEPPSSRVVILDKRFAQSSIVGLMTLHGYSCFMLPD